MTGASISDSERHRVLEERSDGSSPEVGVAVEAASEAASDVMIDVAAFHAELRLRNLPNLLWTAIVINSAYLAWTVFDYILVPDRWQLFLALRLVAVAVITIVVAVVYRRHRHYTWEAFWVMVVVYLSFISPMLPMVGNDLSRYAMGYAVTVFGAGLVPVWHPKWEISALGSSVAITTIVLAAAGSGGIPFRDLVGSGFLIATAVALSIVTAMFKYDLAKRDYLSRARLAAVARRESEARQSLARTSEDLQSALDRLQEVDRLKSAFFANVSHELRTPLTLILAPIDEATARVTDSYVAKQLHVARRNAERLLGLINDLLDLSRVDAGGLRLNLEEVDPRTIAAAVHENAQPAAQARAIEFVISAEPSSRRIWADAHRLEIVLTNLVSNALKFTPAGGRIELRVTDTPAAVRLEVEDTGQGISADDLPRVFERFFQADPSDRRREGGVGIGLSLAKELVELHGGTIAVDSEPGVLTRFTVVIPFGRDHIRPEVIERRRQFADSPDLRRRDEDRVVVSQRDEETAAAPSARDEATVPQEPIIFEGSRRARILLVEDHQEVREFIRTLVEPHYDLAVAADGQEAWKLIQHQPPDLVLSDVMMPALSGTDLCRAIKIDPQLKATPVILLTAKVGSEATLEAYAHGADDFVAKPFHPRVLMARIQAQLKLRALGLELAQKEKLAVVGTLAAGILHEVGNPVNAVLNAVRVLAKGPVKEDLARQLIDVIEEGAKQIEGIISALNDHARPAEHGQTIWLDPREGLDATVKLLSHKLDGVTIQREYLTERPARAPAGPLNQVFLNLIDNAVRAGAATIWLRVEATEDALEIRVGDDGPGVPPQDRERIFQPFYSGRADGSGSGLGLYLSRRMVEEAGGTLRVEQHRAGGAEFVVRLPTVNAKPAAAAVE
jgi:signal transduction histidine kinase